MLVSVIIPVYNVKDYLEKCLNSVMKQTYKQLEIIVVDDGSSDGSSELCDEFAKLDDRIQVIHKENGGLVSARQAGLSLSKGEYILNVDADDWIEDRMVEELLSEALSQNADIVSSGYYKESGTNCIKITDLWNPGVYEDKKYICTNLLYSVNCMERNLTPYIWNKIFKAELIKEIYLKLDTQISSGEDVAAVYVAGVFANKIVVMHKAFYHYMFRQTSITNSNDMLYFERMNKLFLFLKENFEKSEYREILLKQLNIYMIQKCIWGVNYAFGMNHENIFPIYDFDKRMLRQGSKVILYGAGKIGQAYYKQIKADKLYELKGWVDKNYIKYQSEGFLVETPDILKNVEYEYIIIAVKYKEMADVIKKELIEIYKVDDVKLIWLKPMRIIDKYITVT